MKVGVTGAYGLLGWHFLCHARSVEVKVVPAGRKAFADRESLEAFVSSCEAIVHFAGMNRGDEREVAETNVRLAKQLIAALEASGRTPHLLFSSSTHIYRDTAYGASKRECTILFSAWAEHSGGVFTNLVLPNVFGESGKPFYNSVASTFCYQLARDETPAVHQDAQIEQVHAQVVARHIVDLIRSQKGGEVRVQGQPITVTGLLEKLTSFKYLYDQHIIPDVRSEFDRDLFNTYRSYLYPERYPVPLKLHTDERGSLFEAVKSLNGGQSFLSTTKPGITRGNHYHTRKIERFLVVSGEAKIKIRRLYSNEVQVFRVSGAAPSYVDIPTLHTHNITNVGSGELVTFFWTHELFDPQDPDTFMEKVEV